MLRAILTSIIVYLCSQFICVGNIRLLPKRKSLFFYNILAVFCIYSFFNIFFYDTRISFLIVILIFYLLSLTMYYVHEFRGTNINISDILSINTAKEVAGGYTYEIKPVFVIFLIFVVFEFVFQIAYNRIGINIHSYLNSNINIYNHFWYEVLQITLFFVSFFVLKDKISDKQYDYSLNAGENEGYIFNFFSSIPIFHKFIKDSFSLDIASLELSRISKNSPKEFLKNINTKYAHNFANFKLKDLDRPHIIVIMNESFGSVHSRIKTNIPVTPYYDSLSKVTKGNLYVNTFGGGTANTEFEFLTGMTIGNYPYPVMPYNNFVKRDKYSLARYFNALGYKTVAMHPYTATNYHRDKVYKRFGFDELLFFNEFEHKEYVRNYVSDKSMYEEVIKRFDKAKNSSERLFLFGITMQNHSGYKLFNNAKVLSLMSNYRNREAVDAYLSLMKLSDDAIAILINYFKSINDHVLILFFGDHNASFGTEINKLVYDVGLNYECSNAYVTPFFIFDNKNSKDDYIKETSANFLSLELLRKANLPLDDIHLMMDDIYKNFSVYSFHKAKKRKDNKLYDIPIDKYMMCEREYLK